MIVMTLFSALHFTCISQWLSGRNSSFYPEFSPRVVICFGKRKGDFYFFIVIMFKATFFLGLDHFYKNLG